MRRWILRVVLRDRARRLYFLDHQHRLPSGDRVPLARYVSNSGRWH